MILFRFLDYFFIIFHTAFILFNITGWIFKITRKLNLITLSLTAFSWYILGIFYGFGYCFCTDWHFTIREKLGYVDISNSYVHFLILRITGINFNERWVIICTVIVFFISFAVSLSFNTIDLYKYLKKRKFKKNDIASS
jgi:hypothetical protein